MPFALDELIFNREAQEKRLNAPRLAPPSIRNAPELWRGYVAGVAFL